MRKRARTLDVCARDKLHRPQFIGFQVPGGATLGPVHKYPQFHNLGIEALWFETAVLALPPAKALPRMG
jgi:hypothetical protein